MQPTSDLDRARECLKNVSLLTVAPSLREHWPEAGTVDINELTRRIAALLTKREAKVRHEQHEATAADVRAEIVSVAPKNRGDETTQNEQVAAECFYEAVMACDRIAAAPPTDKGRTDE